MDSREQNLGRWLDDLPSPSQTNTAWGHLPSPSPPSNLQPPPGLGQPPLRRSNREKRAPAATFEESFYQIYGHDHKMTDADDNNNDDDDDGIDFCDSDDASLADSLSQASTDGSWAGEDERHSATESEEDESDGDGDGSVYSADDEKAPAAAPGRKITGLNQSQAAE